MAKGRIREIRYFLNACNRAINAIEKMKKTKPKKFKEKLNEEARSIISKWYFSYSPRIKFYKEQESLFDAYRLEQDGIDIYITFDSNYIGDNHHQSAEIVYNNAFVEGYHGGSWGTDRNDITIPKGTLAWRTPTPRYAKGGHFERDENGKMKTPKAVTPYTSWSKRKVEKSFSPYEKIMERCKDLFNEYEEEWEQDLQSNVVDPLRKSLGGLQRK